MKYTMLFAALWWPYCLASQTLYNFISTAGAWNDPASWSPVRTVPKPDDILQFSANANVNGMPTSETIGALKILNGSQIRFTSSSSASLQIGGPAISAPQLFTEAGTTVELSGPSAIHILINTACRGQINGSFRVSGAPHRIEATDSAALVFSAGARFIAASGFTGNAFGIVHLNSAVFKTGSFYQSQDGGNPFGAMAPQTVTIFENGSFYFHQQAIGLSLGGRVYGYLQTEANINLSLFGSVNDVIIQNDLIVNQGYFIFHPNTIHAGSFKIFGSIIQNGSTILDIGNANMTGSVQMLGTSPEIGAGNGTGSCTIHNLYVNSTGAITAKRRLQVNGKLGLFKGNIITDAVNILALGAGALILSPVNAFGNGNEGWEQSFVDGPIQMNISGTDKKVAPVGNLGQYAPIGIEKANSNAANFTIQYFHQSFSDVLSVNNPPLDHVSHVEYWRIFSDLPSDAAKISLSWRPTSFVGSTIIERNDLALAHYTDFGFGTKWNQEGNNPSIYGDNNYGWLGSDNYIVGFSEFTLASKSRLNTLPVVSLTLSAHEVDGIVQFDWNLEPGYRYELERSSESGKVEKLKVLSVPGHDCCDTLSESGIYFYRLKAGSIDGQLYFSPKVRISFNGNSVFSLYPNPCSKILFVKFSTRSSRGTLELVNSQGQLLQTFSPTRTAVNTTWLNKGKYYIRYRNFNKVVTKAFFRL